MNHDRMDHDGMNHNHMNQNGMNHDGMNHNHTSHNGERSFLHACLLLLIAERPDHGYNLAVRLGGLGLAGTEGATTYRALRRLERDGSLASSWTASASGPARRTYHLTGRGRAELHRCGRVIRDERERLSGYLRSFDSVPGLLYRNSAPHRPLRTGGAS